MTRARGGLSKSRFVAGLQCEKMLWWRVHDASAPELIAGPAQQAIFDRGHQVGELARTYVPGGMLIDSEIDLAERVAATARAIADGAKVIYEASFLADEVFVSVDILERVRGGWSLIEVKSTLDLKEQHLPDIAIQLHVLRKSGLTVKRAELMHLNRACRYPRLEELFVRRNVTKDATALLRKMARRIRPMLTMLDGKLPVVETGPHCKKPYACAFVARCHPEKPMPEGEMTVEPELRAALSEIEGPVGYLDFETVALPVPVWPGCAPYETVPVQWSYHVEKGRGHAHHAWLADGDADPREAFARELVAVCAGAKTILAYNASFERRCLDGLARAVPKLKKKLDAIAARLVDLLPIVRAHVYHPDFGGSFSLKAVLPALVSGMDYEDLDVQDGTTASAELERVLFDATMTASERTKTRRALMAYCERDTLAMVKLYERLKELAA